MATVPTTDIRPEDLLDGGELSASKVAAALNRASRVVREALDHGITAENLRVQTVELRIQTAATIAETFPLPAIKLADHMPPVPRAVRVIFRQNLTSPGTAFTLATAADWKPFGERQVSIRYLSGLSASANYVVTLLIEG